MKRLSKFFGLGLLILIGVFSSTSKGLSLPEKSANLIEEPTEEAWTIGFVRLLRPMKEEVPVLIVDEGGRAEKPISKNIAAISSSGFSESGALLCSYKM